MSDTLTQYTVREDGKNGTVEVQPKAIVRVIKKTFGKDDVLSIPLRAGTSVHHDRKTLGTDIVTISCSGQNHSWKIAQAEALIAELNAALYD